VSGFTTDAADKPIKVALAAGRKAEASGTSAGTYAMGLTAEDFVVTSDSYTNINVVVVDVLEKYIDRKYSKNVLCAKSKVFSSISCINSVRIMRYCEYWLTGAFHSISSVISIAFLIALINSSELNLYPTSSLSFLNL
jgi:hypothetical protein